MNMKLPLTPIWVYKCLFMHWKAQPGLLRGTGRDPVSRAGLLLQVPVQPPRNLHGTWSAGGSRSENTLPCHPPLGQVKPAGLRQSVPLAFSGWGADLQRRGTKTARSSGRAGTGSQPVPGTADCQGTLSHHGRFMLWESHHVQLGGSAHGKVTSITRECGFIHSDIPVHTLWWLAIKNRK